MSGRQARVQIAAVPETMLWTLDGWMWEAKRGNRIQTIPCACGFKNPLTAIANEASASPIASHYCTVFRACNADEIERKMRNENDTDALALGAN